MAKDYLAPVMGADKVGEEASCSKDLPDSKTRLSLVSSLLHCTRISSSTPLLAMARKLLPWALRLASGVPCEGLYPTSISGSGMEPGTLMERVCSGTLALVSACNTHAAAGDVMAAEASEECMAQLYLAGGRCIQSTIPLKPPL